MTSEQQAVPVAQEDREAAHDVLARFMTSPGNPRVGEAVDAMIEFSRLAAASLHDMQITPALSLPCKSGEGVEPVAAVEWRCYHCGDVFTNDACARLHFGRDEDSIPACQIKAGAEQGLLGALRDAEYAAADAQQAVANECTDAAKAYYAQATRHNQAMRNAEELGYERGLADGRALSTPSEQFAKSSPDAEQCTVTITVISGEEAKVSFNSQMPDGQPWEVTRELMRRGMAEFQRQFDEQHKCPFKASASPDAETDGLLPCPFCGTAPLIEDGINDRPWVVQCINRECHAQPFMDHADRKRQAIAAWNTRTSSPDAAGSGGEAGFEFATKAEDPFGQPHIEATNLALTATPETFPRDSYGLAQWLDKALFTAVPAAYETGSENDPAAYIRDWCPDHVRDYVAALTPDPLADAGKPIAATQTREAEGEQFAKIAECAFDDRPRSRVGHPSQMDWDDGYRDGTRAAASAIRAALNGRAGA